MPKADSSRSSTPLLLRADIALWRLPRPLRKVIVAPVALAAGVSEAWPEFRYGWRAIMRAVDTRPSERPSDPSEGRGQMPSTEPMDDPPICGRILVGQGDDTYDPECSKPSGHDGICAP